MQKDEWGGLPESMRQIAGVIGLDGAERLVRAIGGARFKFGKGRQNTARMKLLHKAVGAADAAKLAAVFGGDELYIPRCSAQLRLVRNRRFRAAFAALTDGGKTSKAMALTELCPQFGLSHRTADKILAERDVVAVQGALFD
ncbi:Mor transcription activator family protein [Kingella oralis]|uniref:Mor transcription activator family protein n=1 Tax=Kingella oralis TaxID=505 RepID=UPI0034E4864E